MTAEEAEQELGQRFGAGPHWVIADADDLFVGIARLARSDTREALRRFFEVDEAHVVVAVLHALARQGAVPVDAVTAAIADYGIDPDGAPPWDPDNLPQSPVPPTGDARRRDDA